MKQGNICKVGSLAAMESVFGLLLSGSWKGEKPVVSHNLLLLSDVSEDLLREFWDLDSVGICMKMQVKKN